MAKRKRKTEPEERAEAEARSEATARLLQRRIEYHLERLRIERGLERAPSAAEIVSEVEARVAQATAN